MHWLFVHQRFFLFIILFLEFIVPGHFLRRIMFWCGSVRMCAFFFFISGFGGSWDCFVSIHARYQLGFCVSFLFLFVSIFNSCFSLSYASVLFMSGSIKKFLGRPSLFIIDNCFRGCFGPFPEIWNFSCYYSLRYRLFCFHSFSFECFFVIFLQLIFFPHNWVIINNSAFSVNFLAPYFLTNIVLLFSMSWMTEFLLKSQTLLIRK